MRRFFGKVVENKAFIEDEEFLHLKVVLRMKEGDNVVVLDGSETEYVCKILNIRKDCAIAEILYKQTCNALPKKEITLYQAFTKREKLELIVQKAVELGVSNLVLFESDFTVAKDSVTKKDRLEKIVKSACKQCECSVPMNINICKFADISKSANMHDIVLFANEREGKEFDFSSLKKYNKIAIIIGPEGGFSDDEKKTVLDFGAESISLGERILRSETATIVLTGIVSVLSGN